LYSKLTVPGNALQSKIEEEALKGVTWKKEVYEHVATGLYPKTLFS
jgi:hypothetical protein